MTDTIQPLLDHLAADHDAATQRLCDLLTIPSVSTDPVYADDVKRAATWIEDDLKQLGFETQQIAEGGRYRRADAEVPQRFRVGDAVTARNIHPRHHTRLPRYARGRRGEIVRDHGVFVFPDSNAQGKGERPQHLYAVRFSARELWGPEAAESDNLFLDLFEDYLEPAAP